MSEMRTLLYWTLMTILGLICAATSAPQSAGVHVEVLTARWSQKKLLLTWRIINNENRAVYIYSTFLRGPAAAFDQNTRGVLSLHTSLKNKIDAGVNFYPKAEFTELAPGGSIEGTFRDKQLCSELPASKPREVVLDVAFGFEVAKVKEALHLAVKSGEHPANPIVDWRTLAQSKPTVLR